VNDKTKIVRKNAFFQKMRMGGNQTCEGVKQKAGRGKTKRGRDHWSKGQAVRVFM